jgi:hypothetical protein
MRQGLLRNLWDDRTARVPTVMIAIVLVAAPIIGVSRLWKSGALPTLRELFVKDEPRVARRPFTIAGTASSDRPEEALAFAIRYITSEDIPLRIQRRALDGAYLYLPKAKWQDIPYPDRPAVLRALALTWCTRVESTPLTSFTIRDIRSGDELASCLCPKQPN